MKITIVIPCLNEQKTIKKAVQNAFRNLKKAELNDFQIIIADNGSTDNSLRILKRITTKKLQVINVPIKGYGAALHYGILAAKFPYVLFADADLSYDFDELPKFITKINQGYDLILGSRFKGSIKSGAMPFLHQYLGTPILSLLIKLTYKIPTTDSNSGMRAIKKSFYKKIKMKNSGMEWASELLVKTAIAKGKYTEVPITLYPDQRGKKSHLNSWKDGWRHLKVIILLKPKIFLISSSLTILAGSISSIYFKTPHHFFAALIFAEFLVYSFLALKKLQVASSGVDNLINRYLNRLPLVLIGIFFWVLIIPSLLFLPLSLILLKYMLLFQVVIYSIWLFFIETVNTHLINQLTYGYDSQ